MYVDMATRCFYRAKSTQDYSSRSVAIVSNKSELGFISNVLPSLKLTRNKFLPRESLTRLLIVSDAQPRFSPTYTSEESFRGDGGRAYANTLTLSQETHATSSSFQFQLSHLHGGADRIRHAVSGEPELRSSRSGY